MMPDMDTATGLPSSLANRSAVRVTRVNSGLDWAEADPSRPLAPFLIAWRQRQLLRRLVQRDIEQQFQGSVLGKTWALIGSLFILMLYTLAFGLLIKPAWQASTANAGDVVLIYFSGLVIFNFFIEPVCRAPALMVENVSYIKKIIFPLELFAWVVLGGALFRLCIGAAILSLVYLAVKGLPPVTAIVIPLLLALLSLVVVGFVWLLSALAVYLRDIRHMIVVLMPAFMFLSPVFFPLSAVPEMLRGLLYVNPLTFILEGMRGALFGGLWPNWFALAVYAVAAFLFCWFAYRLFVKLRAGFADVL